MSSFGRSKLTALFLILAISVSACGDQAKTDEPDSQQGAAPTGPGSIESSERLFTTDPSLAKTQASVTKIVYASTSGVDGTPTRVSGVVAVPPGVPPAGGWPVVSFAHGTTGVETDCGPSIYPDLYGSATTIATLVSRGYVVAAADYQGLGIGTGHPYLEPTTAAYNVIDAVRAARALVPETTQSWVAYGGSQGGQAAWAAAEEAPEYAPELTMVGSVAGAPAADLVGIADAAIAGTPSDRQLGVLPLIITGMVNVNPSLNIADFMKNSAENLAGTLVCGRDGTVERDTALQKVLPTDFQPATDAAADDLRSWLEDIALPKKPTSVPMLVLYGGQDDLVLPEWVEKAVNRACGLGDVIDAQLQPESGHRVDTTPIGDWVTARFANGPLVNTCEADQ